MAVVEYVGKADVRRLTQAQLAQAGFNVPGGISWDHSNNQRVEIADPTLVAWLLAVGGFEADGVDTFVDAVKRIHSVQSEAPERSSVDDLWYDTDA